MFSKFYVMHMNLYLHDVYFKISKYTCIFFHLNCGAMFQLTLAFDFGSFDVRLMANCTVGTIMLECSFLYYISVYYLKAVSLVFNYWPVCICIWRLFLSSIWMHLLISINEISFPCSTEKRRKKYLTVASWNEFYLSLLAFGNQVWKFVQRCPKKKGCILLSAFVRFLFLLSSWIYLLIKANEISFFCCTEQKRKEIWMEKAWNVFIVTDIHVLHIFYSCCVNIQLWCLFRLPINYPVYVFNLQVSVLSESVSISKALLQ